MDKIKLIKSTFLNEEETKKNLCDFIMDSEILSMSKECEKFEENFSKKQGRKYSIFVSNGSCANLLLIQSMLNMGRLKRGDKVFVSSLTWATNIMPIIQLGLIPVLLDIEESTLNMSSQALREGYEKDPDAKMLFLTNALGFCSDVDEIKKYCEDKNLIFLEDNCESLGSEYKGTKLGNFGLASTFSFFVGHHISTIEGGMICTDDENLYENLKLIRAHGWTRNNSEAFKKERRAENSINNFYDVYTFYDLAYNFRPTEINGFIGNQQIVYWDEIIRKRGNNFNRFYEAASNNKDIIKLNFKNMNIISNFGFPLLFKNKELFEKYKESFIKGAVEIRPIIAGNVANQPFFKKSVGVENVCPNAEKVHKNGFYFGNNSEMTEEEINFICSLLK